MVSVIVKQYSYEWKRTCLLYTFLYHHHRPAHKMFFFLKMHTRLFCLSIKLQASLWPSYTSSEIPFVFYLEVLVGLFVPAGSYWAASCCPTHWKGSECVLGRVEHCYESYIRHQGVKWLHTAEISHQDEWPVHRTRGLTFISHSAKLYTVWLWHVAEMCCENKGFVPKSPGGM